MNNRDELIKEEDRLNGVDNARELFIREAKRLLKLKEEADKKQEE